ncbi:unnamed protein product [Ranitomeya imitator]|uniref:Uncharacterized protein n=1 Tax=Ranitomeya imitator TaxID=111125 RepID=A0ABN9KZJ4_9NEOB|nr:unnamed protein product [Ranitomeya imitator]
MTVRGIWGLPSGTFLISLLLQAAIGANATNILDLPTEFRQLSWSIGGYSNLSDTITLPNILKIFNPHLVGYGKRSTVSYRPAALEDAGLNLAVTGANTLLLPEQVRRLIATLQILPQINFQEDWKIVTIFIGSNDLCDYCNDKVRSGLTPHHPPLCAPSSQIITFWIPVTVS